MKLLAADTPSHRGAWIPGGENWKMITSNGSQEDIQETSEEDDEDEEHTAQSTPVAFRSKNLLIDKMEGKHT